MTQHDGSGEVVALLRRDAPWLLAAELGVCVVGSAALAEACRRAGVTGPRALDVDLAWLPATAAGEAVLRTHGVFCATTAANRARGTLALKLGERRYEITTLRGEAPPQATIEQRIALDLSLRDMTVGAVAWHLASDRIVDPLDGLGDWRGRRIVACGDPRARVHEHPVRLLRYYRRAHEWAFALDSRIRALRGAEFALADLPAEAVSAELRAALLRCPSPGRFLHELCEIQALQTIAPELAPQFDGRPAGPLRHHPEVSQALHLTLALEWAAARTAPGPGTQPSGRGPLAVPAAMRDDERLAVMIAVLTHDLGKNVTRDSEWPSHHAHEQAGLRLVDALLDRLPSLADARARRLARAVCALHLLARRLPELRPRTLARLYDDWLKWNAFPVALFALAVGADAGGRLGAAAEGDRVCAEVAAAVTRIRERCAAVDVGLLWTRHQGDHAAFRRALRAERTRALASDR